jgi:hypothetical protein
MRMRLGEGHHGGSTQTVIVISVITSNAALEVDGASSFVRDESKDFSVPRDLSRAAGESDRPTVGFEPLTAAPKRLMLPGISYTASTPCRVMSGRSI